MYEVKFTPKAAKALKALPADVQFRVQKKIDYLRLTPRGTDTKKLVGKKDLYRTRIGHYRILYEIEDEKLLVWVVEVDTRGGVYKN